MGDEADRIEAVSAGKPFKPVDVELEFSVIRAGIIFFATLEFVDNAINLVELFGARIDEFLLQAF
jgi:hypothetical protein